MPTFEEQFVELWHTFAASTHDPDINEEQLKKLWDDMSDEVDALLLTFSHPPGKPRKRP